MASADRPRVTVLPLLLATAIASPACGGASVVQTEGPAAVVGVSPSQVRGPYVPAGRQLTIILANELSTAQSTAGEPFAALVEAPSAGTDGSVLVPAGSTVSGRVAMVRNGWNQRLVLQFDAVETPAGSTPLFAKVLDVAYAKTPTAEVEGSLLAYPSGAQQPEGASAGHEIAPSSEVVLPAGTHFRLELTRPLFPPGTTATPRAARATTPASDTGP